MTIREAAKTLSERMSHRIGPASVMDLIQAGRSLSSLARGGRVGK